MSVPILIAISTATEPIQNLPLRDHSYVCATLDFWPSTKCDYGNCSWVDTGAMALDFENSILNQAAEMMGPNFLYRIGGTLADHVRFDGQDRNEDWGHCTCDDPENPTAETCYFKDVGKNPPNGNFAGFENACLSGARLDQIMNFANIYKSKLIFDFSSEYGKERLNYLQWTGDWKPDNAKEMFDYIKDQKMEHLFYGFELGNEVWGILTGDAHFDAEQAARDYKTFRELIDDSFGPGQKKLLTLSGNWESFFMERFTQLFNDFDGVAWHWYPLGAGSGDGVIPNINDPKFLKNKIIPRLDEIELYNRRHKKDLWMGETGGAFNSGQNTTTNTFMSHRWYLDQLGMFAQKQHKGYCRQTFIGGNYGLLENIGGEYNPNPDFYAAFLFHKIMGDAVFPTTVKILNGVLDTDYIHTYAHFKGSTGYTTVLIINFHREEDVTWSEYNGLEYENILSFIGSAGDDQDKVFTINDQRVEVSNGIIPNVLDYGKELSMPITIPSKSYGFFSFRTW